LWGRILASALDRPLRYHRGGEGGPAYGAARLARLAFSGEDPATVCAPPPVERVVEPDTELRDRYRQRLAQYRLLYAAVKERWPR
jgi:xylulokinase